MLELAMDLIYAVAVIAIFLAALPWIFVAWLSATLATGYWTVKRKLAWKHWLLGILCTLFFHGVLLLTYAGEERAHALGYVVRLATIVYGLPALVACVLLYVPREWRLHAIQALAIGILLAGILDSFFPQKAAFDLLNIESVY